MAEWINLYSASKISGFSAGWIAKLIRRGSVSADNARRNGNQWEITTSEAERLRLAKIDSDAGGWTNHEIMEAPANAVHIPDPHGDYEGLWLTPEEAARYVMVRANMIANYGTHVRYVQLARMFGDG